MMVLSAVLVDGATPSISTSAAAEAQAATVALGEDGRSAAVLDPCGLEAAACIQDADCRDCEARRRGQGGMGGAESAGRGDRWPRVSWDEFRINHSSFSGGAGSPSNNPCENVGTVACGRVTTALGAVSAEEGYATASENPCRDNPVVKELFACRMASAGCELEDAPCATQNPRRLQPREAPSEFVDDEGYRHARSLAAWRSGSGAWRATCRTCSGSGCSSKGDDGEECCTSSVIACGVPCSVTGWKAPCVVVEAGHCRSSFGPRRNFSPISQLLGISISLWLFAQVVAFSEYGAKRSTKHGP
ncbi:unnamed protein product [Ectocarpus sp. 12 AP-2014]